MKQARKKRAGRPRGRVEPHRPVIGARVPQALYDEIKEAAAAAGRTMSEELVWRAERAGEYFKALGEVDKWYAKQRDEQAQIARGNLEIVLMGLNWKKDRRAPFGKPNWVSSDNHSIPPNGFIDSAPEAEEAKPAQPQKRKQS
jgi:hypothetical protein